MTITVLLILSSNAETAKNANVDQGFQQQVFPPLQYVIVWERDAETLFFLLQIGPLNL